MTIPTCAAASAYPQISSIPVGSTSAGKAGQTDQSSHGGLDRYVDLYAPTAYDPISQPGLTESEFETIETQFTFESLVKQDETGIQSGLETKFLPEDARLNHELNVCAKRELNAHPEGFLKFVSAHTNPRRAWFSFKNLLHIIADYVSLRKPTLLLNANCVHCAAAVDRTLSQFTAEGRDSSAPKMYQVAEARPGCFTALMSEQYGQSVDAEANFVYELKEVIDRGSRGCISIPVKNRKFSHAMNVVHMADGGGIYIVCGQQNRVYNLNDPADLQHFWGRYEIQPGRSALIARTGRAPQIVASVPGAQAQDWA